MMWGPDDDDLRKVYSLPSDILMFCENMPQTKDIVVTKFKAFCKHSTLHGLYYFYKSSRWTVHLIWITIIIAGLILCAFLSHMIWIKFVIDPTFTVVESTRYSVSEVPFPAVSICDAEPVYGPNTANITDIFERRGFSGNEIDAFYNSIERVRHLNYIPHNQLLKMHGLLESLGIRYQVLLDMLNKPCDILLLECVWRSKIYNCSDMFREVQTYLGYCCQFDIPYFRKNVKGVAYASGIEMTEGLMVRINTNSVSHTGEIFEGSAQLFLFDYKDSVTVLDSAITLTANVFYDVNVDVWVTDSSDNVKALSLNSRKCLLSSDKGADFYQGCLTAAILQKVIENCRCVPFNYTSEELQVAVTTKCSWDRMFCIYATLDDTFSDLKDLTAKSGCYQKCDFVQYETNVKYVREKTSLTSGNYTTFLVHFADNSCMKYRREVLYSWDQMLANLGGIFGLCVGGSVISIIELLWFIIDLLCSLAVSRRVTPEKKFSRKDFVSKLSPNKIKNNFNKRLPFVH